jgi:hypothetical protein
MTLKEKIERTRKIDDIKHEMATYEQALVSGSDYSEYYTKQLTNLQTKLDSILA